MSCKQCRDLQRTYEACYSYAFDASATRRVSPQCPDCAARLRAEVDRLRKQVADLEAENKQLQTWAGLMSILDRYYPADLVTGQSGDPGPRVVVLIREVDRLRKSEDAAWGIIANAWEGDWSKAGDDWRGAAERWRDEYHSHLPSAPSCVEQPEGRENLMMEADREQIQRTVAEAKLRKGLREQLEKVLEAREE